MVNKQTKDKDVLLEENVVRKGKKSYGLPACLLYLRVIREVGVYARVVRTGGRIRVFSISLYLLIMFSFLHLFRAYLYLSDCLSLLRPIATTRGAAVLVPLIR
jgi:hypothetical protein